jgi:hypothetical protein
MIWSSSAILLTQNCISNSHFRQSCSHTFFKGTVIIEQNGLDNPIGPIFQEWNNPRLLGPPDPSNGTERFSQNVGNTLPFYAAQKSQTRISHTAVEGWNRAKKTNTYDITFRRKYILNNTKTLIWGLHRVINAGPGCRAVKGAGLRPLACWDCGFEYHRGHGYLSAVSVVCC